MKILFILIALLIPSFIISQHAAEMIGINEEMPVFPGCDETGESRKSKQDCTRQKLVEYIYSNLKYPAEAKSKKVEGMAVVQFYIDQDGNMQDIKLVRDIGSGCGQAALDVVNSMSNMVIRDTIITFNDRTYEETVKVVSHKQKWRPGYQRGKAVKILYTLPVRFKLDNNRVEKTLGEPTQPKDRKWRNYPPEYASYQDYKEQVLVPTLVKSIYTIEPIELSKIVGDIIPYGSAMHPILKKMGSHNGIDFRAVPGVPVVATADGIVESISTTHDRYGQFVKIKHSEETQSLYAHMSSINVKEGQSIKAGEQIGAVGMTGKATYPHLHYEVHVNGQTENPILYNQNINENKNRNVIKNELTGKQKLKTTTELQFDLQQNYPNPFLDYTTINFNLPSDRPASLLFYNQSGEYVYGIKDSFSKGLNEVKIFKTDLNTSGLIYYFLIQDRMTAVKKLIIPQ